MSEAKIACRNLWKLYGSDPAGFLRRNHNNPSIETIRAEGYVPAVRNVSFDVTPGEILVVMGLSGSGKSTLLRCLARLIEPTSGEVMFEGRDILAATERELIDLRRHKMGMVFQHFALLPHRTVLDNVAFPLQVRGTDRQKRERRAREVIELVGLKGREGYYPRELSGGQQQRVGIARSLAVGPDVWFLDEPFSALDPLIRREMQDEFLRLQKVLNKTIVFITHDFDEAIRVADRIAIMKDGVVEQLGTAEELVTCPATPYVAEFTRNVSHDRLLSVRAVMAPASSRKPDAAAVHAQALIASVVRQVLTSERPVDVIDDAGALVGTLTRDGLIDALYGKEQCA
ncbi:glycine betaine/L-proline ABC transporter ATP-binding protein [Aminobacter sp. NyZ550]|uniref:quaternary amine ABC transporter ATP-binding protein n=1 Tax=Aminobacter sp. NyZ550 TaxID=2979870 RepID=UPI0021D5CA36|nr:glycine betaine/L-proline ABC transporter ATP-binding protein [Aminobacter sp. NyZ550]WAX96945.1 glycine betaine/L-proline ABC transporter ATP-binding protein [Aminobacter sp. NyZ550]